MAKVLTKKPTTPGAKPNPHRKGDPPGGPWKASERAKLVAKGVPANEANTLVGQGENLTADEIAARRIAWQKTLPKA